MILDLCLDRPPLKDDDSFFETDTEFEMRKGFSVFQINRRADRKNVAAIKHEESKTMSTIPTVGSNSLPDLAARIRVEHEAVGATIKSGAEHAMTFGDLLILAKAKLDQHGARAPVPAHDALDHEAAVFHFMHQQNRGECTITALGASFIDRKNASVDLSPIEDLHDRR
jgi:hypothetical protein